MLPKIKNGAIFIADAHENGKLDNFYNFLKKIDSREIKTPQLFLMGDMFDLLVGKVTCTVKKYENYIKLLNKIALRVEIFYFEGNHDFYLEEIFKDINIVTIKNQPMKFLSQNSREIHLSHGDNYIGIVYSLYTTIVRSKWILTLLNYVDERSNNWISKKIQNNQRKKNLCFKIENFKELIDKKLHKYKTKKDSYVIEGHYHQGFEFTQKEVNYINLPSFACNQSYFIVEYSHEKKFALRGTSV